MVEQLGINVLIPILVFGFIVVGAYLISDAAFQDVLRRREQEGSK
jgi:hypothetical protein